MIGVSLPSTMLAYGIEKATFGSRGARTVSGRQSATDPLVVKRAEQVAESSRGAAS